MLGRVRAFRAEDIALLDGQEAVERILCDLFEDSDSDTG